MRRRITGGIMLLVLAGGVLSARAEQPPVSISDQTDVAEQLASMQEELAQLREQVYGAHSRPVTRVMTHSASGGWLPGAYGGVELMALSAHTKNNQAIQVNNATTTSEVPHDYGVDFSLRYFAGVTARNGTGLRASYFNFDDEADTIRYTDPGVGFGFSPLLNRQTFANGEQITADQSLDLRSLDLELTHQYRLGRLYGNASAGVRYSYYGRYSLQQIFDPGPVLDHSGWQSDRFRGVGPTLACTWNLPFNRTIQGLSLFGGLRASLAFGQTDSIVVTRRFLNPGPGIVTRNERLDEQDTLLVGELQLGAQYVRGPVFLRAGLETQYWEDAGEQIFPMGGSQRIRSDLGLFGFNLTTGFVF